MNTTITKHCCERLKRCYAHLQTFKGVNLSACGIDARRILDIYVELMKFPATLTDPLEQARWAILICDAELLLEADHFEWVNGQAWHRQDVRAFLRLWGLGVSYADHIFGAELARYVDRFQLAACYDQSASDEAFTAAWHRFAEYAQAYQEYEAAERILDMLAFAIPA
jgi:hypothetical protein